MKLLIDFGNSRVKWALVREGAIEGPFGFGYRADDCEAEFEAAWHALAPEAVLLCSVAEPAATAALREWVRRRWGLAPAQLAAEARTGALRSAYREPQTLGADRWANLLGARALLGAADVVVVDAGTAVTVDGLRADGVHVGGAICAGLAATRRGLAQAAPALADACRSRADGDLPAGETATAVGAGTRIALAGAVERVARAVGAGLEHPAHILTGGDGADLAAMLGAGWRHEPLLTMHGLLAAEATACAG